jgi:hypothetical protein
MFACLDLIEVDGGRRVAPHNVVTDSCATIEKVAQFTLMICKYIVF